MTMTAEDIGDRPLWGLGAIAEFLNLPQSTVHRMLKRGQLPAKQIGKRWVSTRRALLQAVTPSEPRSLRLLADH